MKTVSHATQSHAGLRLLHDLNAQLKIVSRPNMISCMLDRINTKCCEQMMHFYMAVKDTATDSEIFQMNLKSELCCIF